MFWQLLKYKLRQRVGKTGKDWKSGKEWKRLEKIEKDWERVAKSGTEKERVKKEWKRMKRMEKEREELERLWVSRKTNFRTNKRDLGTLECKEALSERKKLCTNLSLLQKQDQEMVKSLLEPLLLTFGICGKWPTIELHTQNAILRPAKWHRSVLAPVAVHYHSSSSTRRQPRRSSTQQRSGQESKKKTLSLSTLTLAKSELNRPDKKLKSFHIYVSKDTWIKINLVLECTLL